mmetsp:Transcript_13283/g.20503  ORF Transcript_13283/g.20503 Transcript_13283/m.20503 type:complete len:90 (+) Transcript_13283:589-858(+)
MTENSDLSNDTIGKERIETINPEGDEAPPKEGWMDNETLNAEISTPGRDRTGEEKPFHLNTIMWNCGGAKDNEGWQQFTRNVNSLKPFP